MNNGNFPTSLTLHIFLFSSLAEYILLRFLSRLGPIFPQGRLSSLVLEVFFYLGALALNFAAITGLLFLLLWIIYSYIKKKSILYPLPVLAALAISVAGFLLSFYSSIISTPDQLLVLTGFSWLSMFLALIIWHREKKETFLTLLVLFSYTLVYLQFWARQDMPAILPVQAKYLLAIAELLAIAAPLLALAIFKPGKSRLALALAAIMAVFVFILYIVKPGIAAALAMWNQSFTGYLPFLLYPLAVGLYVYNVVALYISSKYKTAAIGMALIALGGFRLEYTYFNLLALSGFLLLARGSSNAEVMTNKMHMGLNNKGLR